MIRWFAIAFFSSMIGCGLLPEKEVVPNPTGNDLSQITSANTSSAMMDEEVLYLLMAAELAGQRNQYDLAMDAYLQAAKRVDDPRIAERAVKIGLFLKDEKRTQEAVSVWLAKDAKNISARKFALLISIKNADMKSAVENITTLISEDPAGFEAGMLDLIKLFEKEGRTKFTYDALEQVLSQVPDQVNILFIQAVLASMIPDHQLAEIKISQVLDLQPEWSRAIIFKAQLAGRTGDLKAARHYLEKAIKQSPDDLTLKKMLIEVLVNLESYEDALRVGQQVLDERSDDAEVIFSMAMIHLQLNQVDKSEQYLERLSSNPEWDDQASYYLGKIAQQRKQFDKALSWFNRINEGRFVFDANLSAVTILMGQKLSDEAEQRLQAMDARFPEQHQKILITRAELLNQLGNYQGAFDQLSLVLKDSPESRDVLYARALVAEKLNKLDFLEQDLLKILDKNPNDVGALNALGYTLVDKTSRLNDAKKYLAKAMKIQPNEPVVVDSYGWLLFKQGDLDGALVYLKKAYLKMAEGEIAAHIVQVLSEMGSRKEAKDFYDAALKKAPEDEYLLKIRELVYPVSP